MVGQLAHLVEEIGQVLILSHQVLDIQLHGFHLSQHGVIEHLIINGDLLNTLCVNVLLATSKRLDVLHSLSLLLLLLFFFIVAGPQAYWVHGNSHAKAAGLLVMVDIVASHLLRQMTALQNVAHMVRASCKILCEVSNRIVCAAE